MYTSPLNNDEYGRVNMAASSFDSYRICQTFMQRRIIVYRPFKVTGAMLQRGKESGASVPKTI